MKTIAVRECHAFGNPPVTSSPGIDVPGMAISAAVESSSFEDQTDSLQRWTRDEHHLLPHGLQFLVQSFPTPCGWTRWLLQYPEQHPFRCRTLHCIPNGRVGCVRP